MTALHWETTGGPYIVKAFQALSDDTRQRILHLLESRDSNVGEIVSGCNLTQPAISRHLKVLHNADLVTRRRDGARVIYSINGEVLGELLPQFFGRFSGCDEFLK